MRHSAPRLQLAVQVFEGVARCPGRFAPRSESIGQVLAHLVDMRVRVVVNIEKVSRHSGERNAPRCRSFPLRVEPKSVIGQCGAGPWRRPSSRECLALRRRERQRARLRDQLLRRIVLVGPRVMPPASLSASRKFGQCRFHASIAARLVGGG